jgi:AraC-like DNA-binding protein
MPVSGAHSAYAESIDLAPALAEELPVTAWFHQLGDIALITSVFHAESRISFDEVGTNYYVHLPMIGRLESRHRGTQLIATRDAAAVYQPDGGAFSGHWTQGTRSLAVSLPRESVLSALTNALGEPPKPDLRFDLAMRAADVHARGWLEMVVQVDRQLSTPGSLLTQPAVAGPLAESIVTGLLYAVRNSYSEALARPAPSARPKAVRTAVELMEADPTAPWTVAALAQRCEVSARTLQSGFRHHLGVSPLGYLRAVRLRRAHGELRAADPFTDSVAAIARRWSFQHLGRFAAAHEAEYGQTPSQTLRSRYRTL